MSKTKRTGTEDDRVMMISKTMEGSLNLQVANELNAAHTYLAMALHLERTGYRGFSKRFTSQSEEERGHALKIVKYLQTVGADAKLDGLARPKAEYPSVRAVVAAALDAELTVTKQINELTAQALRENDYATRSFLQWFVDEQVEEVSSMSELLQLIDLAGESNLFQIDSRLGAAE